MSTSQIQYDIMVSFMEENPGLAKGFLTGPNAKMESSHKWTWLVDELNSNGPPERDMTRWRKVSIVKV